MKTKFLALSALAAAMLLPSCKTEIVTPTVPAPVTTQQATTTTTTHEPYTGTTTYKKTTTTAY